MAEEASKRLSVRVTGKVQGVGFRHFTRTRAQAYKLAGWVRNEHDGSVYTVAEGPRTMLDLFLRDLQQGPPGSCVSNTQINWAEATGEFERFSVEF
jgi:acylphosphatase